jgi:hypothetical protein
MRVSAACWAFAIALVTAGRGDAATFDLQSASITDINAAFDAGALSSEKLVKLCIARINAYDHRLRHGAVDALALEGEP